MILRLLNIFLKLTSLNNLEYNIENTRRDILRNLTNTSNNNAIYYNTVIIIN